MKLTGIIRDGSFLMHDMGLHPECPQRLEALYSMLDELGPILNLKEIPVRQALTDEIITNHDPRYVALIAATAGSAHTFLDPDTSACAHSWEAAAKAVGGLYNLVDAVVDGTVRNGFALVRPPGHHAERRRAMGFCLFNNIALAARHAISRHGIERVAIVDWDVHHGNGTQNSFYEDPRVLFVSIHQYPHYPGTGAVKEVGRGDGEGYTVNVPLSSGAGDREYAAVFHTVVAPVVEAFKPGLILVSAGFDAHRNDPLGGMDLTEDGYAAMMQILMDLAAEYCRDRLVLALEGGYNLSALSDSVGRLLTILGSYDSEKNVAPFQLVLEDFSSSFKTRLRDALNVQRKYWPNLITL
jgi:acetoin utilization deacetylase AcuC-like enzyme